MTPNWKEKLEELHRRGNTNDLVDFIEKEVIEKLIEEIPEDIKYVPSFGLSVSCKRLKKELKSKWLSKTNE